MRRVAPRARRRNLLPTDVVGDYCAIAFCQEIDWEDRIWTVDTTLRC